MIQIRPVSDLENEFPKIETIINKYLVYLTRIDMVNRHMKSERIRKTDRQHCDEIR